MINEIVKSLKSNNFIIEESLFFKGNKSEFWHSTVLDDNQNPVSAGFGSNLNMSRKIAISEFLERTFYHKIKAEQNNDKENWGLDIIPTACGFAAGFDRPNTIHRSIAEATERWVMSKWIDDGYYIREVPLSEINSELDEVSNFFMSYFDRVLFFEKDVVVNLTGINFKIRVVQTMGLKGNGIYPGSSAQIENNIWQHALLESVRHLLLVKNNNPINRFPENKIRFFSNNSNLALNVISKAKITDWPIPKVLMHKSIGLENNSYFIARTILSGWNSWHLGPIERFLY